jgi:hypothetical protein
MILELVNLNGIQAKEKIHLKLKDLNNMPTKKEKNEILKRTESEFGVIKEKQQMNLNEKMESSKNDVIYELKELRRRIKNIKV